MHTAENRKRARVVLAALLVAWLAGCGQAPDVDVPPARAAETDGPALGWIARVGIDRFLEASACLGFQSGYVAMFARDGRVVHTTAVGYADIASHTPMRLDTRFRIASMTKPITAVAAMILVEEGRLDLDAMISARVTLEETTEALAAMAAGEVTRSVIMFDGASA